MLLNNNLRPIFSIRKDNWKTFNVPTLPPKYPLARPYLLFFPRNMPSKRVDVLIPTCSTPKNIWISYCRDMGSFKMTVKLFNICMIFFNDESIFKK